MGKIKLLSHETIARVSAGEVIEKPASIVKELVENALDAGADLIKVQTQAGGLEKIIVQDNGAGMDKSDLVKSIQRYTTSKIKTEDSLESIKTFGFRGEALYSINAVSQLSIKSRRHAATQGYSLNDEKITPIGSPKGTTVEIEHIFSRVPARKRFLDNQSSPTKSLKDIVEVLEKFAIAHPKVGFSYKDNKKGEKDILILPKNQTLKKRLSYLLDRDFASKFWGINYTKDFLKITGYIPQPQHVWDLSSNQYLFVNRRPVENKEISKTVKEAYQTLINSKATPPFILFLELPYEMVDVNAHPQKTTVRLLNETEILQSINDAITQTFDQHGYAYNTTDIFHSSLNTYTKGDMHLMDLLKKTTKTWNIKTGEKGERGEKEVTPKVLQIHNTYIVTPTSEGMLILDQHAAHERILFQNFLDEFSNTKKNQIKVEENIKLTPREKTQAEDLRETSQDIGFEFLVTEKSMLVTKIPQVYAKRPIHSLIKQILADTNTEPQVHATLAYLACRSAVRAGDYLTQEEMENLIKELAQTRHNFTCPHGRPLSIELTLKELDSMFKRT